MGILFAIFLVLVILAVGVNVFAFFYERKYKRKLNDIASKCNVDQNKN